MTSKTFLVAFTLTALAVACSTAETPANDDQALTADQTACEASDQCMAIATFPCCSSKKSAINKKFQAEAEQQAHKLCLVAACAPDFNPDNRVAACQEKKCVMVDPREEKVAGFDLEGFKIATRGGDEICPEIVDAIAEKCFDAGGVAAPVKSCKSLCSVPVAPNGKAAGFDFSGFRIAPSGLAEICAAVVRAEEEACFKAGGKTSPAEGCSSLCSLPIANDGKVAGYDFTGPKILPAPEANTACPEIVVAEQEACIEAKGRVIAASQCRSLCSTPIVDPR